MTRPRALFLHPVALDAHAADRLDIPGLISPAFPGHGDRQRRAGVRLDDMVDEIVGWIQHPVDVIGCSMGGMVAMRLALRHPALVRSLVLGFTTARSPRELMLQRADATELSGSGMVESTLARWFSDAALAASPVPPGVAYARERLRATPPAVIADAWRAIAEHDVLDELHALRMPTLCIAGSADQSTPLAALDSIAAAIPGARLHVMQGPHMAFLEDPVAFRSVVLQHLKSQEHA